MRIGHISTFAPTRCGIAAYTADLIGALTAVISRKYRLAPEPSKVAHFAATAFMRSRVDFARMAHAINCDDVEVVNLQHEFGIWGGAEGEYLLDFLRCCRKPIVATVHTPNPGSSRQAQFLQMLCKSSQHLVVLTEFGRAALLKTSPNSKHKISVIPHGVPRVPYVSNKRGEQECMRFISPGFFRPDKGLEIILSAMEALKNTGYYFRYSIVGAPQSQFRAQERYFREIQQRLASSDVVDCVSLIRNHFSRGTLIRLIQGSDCGIIGYQTGKHSSSGIVPLILACGRPVVCTPIEYARSMSALPGLFISKSMDVRSMEQSLEKAIQSRNEIRSLPRYIHTSMQPFHWSAIAAEYRKLFLTCKNIDK